MKKTLYIFVAIAVATGFFWSALGMTLPAQAIAPPPGTEILYLSDSMSDTDGLTRIYRVDLDATSTRANLIEITGSPITLNQVDALAASPDGTLLYTIDKDTSKLASITVPGGVYHEIGTVQEAAGPAISQIVLAAVAPDGTLYAASQGDDNIYTVSTSTAVAVSKGKVFNGATALDLSGADLVFATDGAMYIWTNANKSGAPNGLYVVNDPSAMPLAATYLGKGTGNFFTGLAIRNNGGGDLVGSDTNADKIVVIDKTDGSMPLSYSMYKDDAPYAYAYGDMTAGPIINPLHIDKTVNTSYTRTWEWEIDKISTTTNLILAAGEQYLVNYEVEVSAMPIDSAWLATGTISVHNPNIIAATITEVTDAIGTSTPSVVCPVSFPYVLAPLSALECTYSDYLDSGITATNTAMVITSGLIPGNTVEEPVVFGEPTLEVDETANASDDYYGVLGALTATTTPYEFNYSWLVGPYAVGNHIFENVAIVVPTDTSSTSTDNHLITIEVPDDSCTLTQGYWKTHSDFGPAPYDETWNGMEDDAFYLSGQNYYQVLWTSPKGGNAYYQLAHQYIAAHLNVLNGASVPTEVSAAMSSAHALFNVHTPAEIGALKGNSTLRKDFLNLASILASYNEGKIGPGHCSEQSCLFVEAFELLVMENQNPLLKIEGIFVV